MQVIEGALAHALHGGAHGAVAGGHDDLYFGVDLLHLAQGGDAVHAGHHDVHDGQVEFFGLDLFYAVVPVVGAGHPVAQAREGGLDQLQYGLFVVDHEDIRFMGHTGIV